MSDKNDINNAKYSLAMIELNNDEKALVNYEKKYEEADRILNYILLKDLQDEVMKDLLNDYVFTTYASCSKTLKSVKRFLENNKKALSIFLLENPEKAEEFNEKYIEVLTIIESYEAELDKRIKKCYNLHS